MMEDLIVLPPGWHIEPEPFVGVSLFDDSGSILPVYQYPRDDNTLRKMAWNIWMLKLADAIAQARRGEGKKATTKDLAIATAIFEWLQKHGVL